MSFTCVYVGINRQLIDYVSPGITFTCVYVGINRQLIDCMYQQVLHLHVFMLASTDS
jgi:hypothetical protein